jgi:hypothetical protein
MQYYGVSAKTGWLGIRIICQSGTTCLSTNCCFSGLTLWKSNWSCWSSTKQTSYFIQIYPVSEGYLRKIPVERRGKYPERRGTFDCPRNRYFSQITLTNRIYLFNSVEYLTANKTVACKQVQNFRPPRSFDFQLRRDVINCLKKGFRLERDIFL